MTGHDPAPARRPEFENVATSASSGLLYGGILLGFALYLAGAGHGTYVPLMLFASPFVWPVPAAFVSALLIWPCVGVALASGRRRALATVGGFLLLHYLVAIVAIWLNLPGESGEFRHAVETAPAVLIGAFALYACGQMYIWQRLWVSHRYSLGGRAI